MRLIVTWPCTRRCIPERAAAKHVGKLGDDLGQGLSQRVGFDPSDQLLGGSIHDADAAFGVDADDAGARARQNRLGETAAAVDQVAGAHDVVALRAQLLRHLVEGLAELSEVAFRASRRHLNVEIAGRDDLRRADQAPDRRHEIVGEVQSDPDRGQKHDERDHRVHQCERDLDADPARGEIGVLGDAGLRGAQLRQHARVEQAGNVQIGVVVTAQLDDGGDVIVVEEHRHLRLGVVDRGQHVGRRLDESLADLRVHLIDHVEVLVEQHDRRQSADRGLNRQELMELLARLIEQRLGAREFDGDRDAVGAHELHVLAHIGVGDDE